MSSSSSSSSSSSALQVKQRNERALMREKYKKVKRRLEEDDDYEVVDDDDEMLDDEMPDYFHSCEDCGMKGNFCPQYGYMGNCGYRYTRCADCHNKFKETHEDDAKVIWHCMRCQVDLRVQPPSDDED